MTTLPPAHWPGHNEVEETTACLGPFRTDGAEIFLEPRGSQLTIHWRAQSAPDLRSAIELALAALRPRGFSAYIEFIPAEFEPELLAAGFQIHSEYIDAWNDDLNALDLTAPDLFSVRPVMPGDYYAAAGLTRACAGASRGFAGETAEWAADWLREPGRAAFMAGQGDSLVGVIFTGLYHSPSRSTQVCWVRELAVAPAARGQGVGRELTLAALRWGQAHGAGISFLAVDRENTPAIRLYQRLGYRLAAGRGQVNLIRDASDDWTASG